MIRSIPFPGQSTDIQFLDNIKTADPIEYYDQSESVLDDITPVPLWSMFMTDSTGNVGPTAGRDQLGYRVGKMMWVTDINGQATSTGAILVDFREIQTLGAYPTNETITIRWYQAGVAKSRSFVGGNTPTGDVLACPQWGTMGPNYFSILLIKASRKLWFAYFVDQ